MATASILCRRSGLGDALREYCQRLIQCAAGDVQRGQDPQNGVVSSAALEDESALEGSLLNGPCNRAGVASPGVFDFQAEHESQTPRFAH